jgi:hypothetical protein
MSKQVSPIKAEMFTIPGDDGRISIDLIGEDGRYIARQLLDYPKYAGKNIAISPQIPFQINAVAEMARLILSSNDKYGRLIFLTSVDILLLSVGENELNLPGYQLENYIIRSPRQDAVVSGGILHVEGLIKPVNDRPVIFELTDENGNVVGSNKQVIPEPAGDLSHNLFAIDIPYLVDDITPVRLTIRQESNTRIPGNVALVSLEITVAP